MNTVDTFRITCADRQGNETVLCASVTGIAAAIAAAKDLLLLLNPLDVNELWVTNVATDDIVASTIANQYARYGHAVSQLIH